MRETPEVTAQGCMIFFTLYLLFILWYVFYSLPKLQDPYYLVLSIRYVTHITVFMYTCHRFQFHVHRSPRCVAHSEFDRLIVQDALHIASRWSAYGLVLAASAAAQPISCADQLVQRSTDGHNGPLARRADCNVEMWWQVKGFLTVLYVL